MRVHDIQQLLEQHQPLGIAQPSSEHDAIEAPFFQTSGRHGLGSFAEVHEAADHFLARRAYTVELRVDERAYELRRQRRSSRELHDRRIEPKG